MKSNTTINIQPFERTYSLAFIDFLSEVLPDFGISDVDVMCGWAWGNEIYNWETRTITLCNLKVEIEQFENQHLGAIGNDDLVLKIDSHNLEITLCHENDLHIQFAKITPLIERILSYVSLVFSEITLEKQYFTSEIFHSYKPTFLVSYGFIPKNTSPITINLEQWGKNLECSPKELLQINSYSSQAELLIFEQNGNSIKVKNRNSGHLMILCDKILLLNTKELGDKDVA